MALLGGGIWHTVRVAQHAGKNQSATCELVVQRIFLTMLKPGLLILLLATAAADAAESSDKLTVNLAGAGSRTCAYWLSSQQHKTEGTVWIYGFWSGLNYVAAASEQDQAKTTSAAMVTAVEEACRRDPSRVLATAAWSAYVGLEMK